MERYTQWSGKNTCPWHRHSDGTPASIGITFIISKMKTNSNLAFSFNWVQKSDTLEGRSSRTFFFSFFLQFTIVCRKHPLVRRCCGYTAIRKLLTLVEKRARFLQCGSGRSPRWWSLSLYIFLFVASCFTCARSNRCHTPKCTQTAGKFPQRTRTGTESC